MIDCMTIVEPRAPSVETLASGRYVILSADGSRLICWCPIHSCGAVYNAEAGVWWMQQPLSFGEFLTALRAQKVLVDSSADLAQWIETCSAEELPRPTAPGGVG